MFGVINLNKPLHCTSHDVVAKVRKKLGLKKVGHGGTLDPLAQGVLPVCVGDATRLIEYFPGDKRYRAWVQFGITTLSWDAEGDVLQEQSAKALTEEFIRSLLPQFQGKIQQQVPPHAAVHVKGKKLYEYTRRGIAVELPVREAEVYTITLVEFQNQGQDHPIAVLDVHCASGTYIRSIAQALGKVTGAGAFLSGLTRTAHGRFVIEESILLDDFLASPSPESYLLNPAQFIPLQQLPLSVEQTDKIRHGVKLPLQEFGIILKNDQRCLLLDQGWPVAVAKGESTGRLKPIKVLHSS